MLTEVGPGQAPRRLRSNRRRVPGSPCPRGHVQTAAFPGASVLGSAGVTFSRDSHLEMPASVLNDARVPRVGSVCSN